MYNTKQKMVILDYLKNNSNRCFTVDELRDELNSTNIKVSVATLYRYLDNLTSDNKVRKFVMDNVSKACYQFIDDDDCHNHFHMICTKCNKLIHLECEEVDEFIKHVSSNHKFKIDLSRVVFYGLCEECGGSK